MKTLALILAGGRGTRLDILSAHRAKPSIPFGGKFRLIDFALSNCVNSGIYNVGVLTQYLPRSLNKHLGKGKPWDLDRRQGGVTILQPFLGGEEGWYKGTAHAVCRNKRFIQNQDPDEIIILSGDHVHKMDYSKLINYHRSKEADLTIAAQTVDYEEDSRFGILDHDDRMKITDFVEKPEEPPSNLASLGIYVFDTKRLLETLENYCTEEKSDFGHHVIPFMIQQGDSYVYEFDGYWKDVGTIDSYWETNFELLKPLPELNLYDEEWKIYTRNEEKPPVKFGDDGKLVKSLVSNGAIINGQVENSIISPGVYIERGAYIRDSIIFADTTIRSNSKIEKTIIDKEVEVKSNCQIGRRRGQVSNQEEFASLDNELNLIAKGAVIPAETNIERNCRIFPQVDEKDLANNNIAKGTVVRHKSS